LGRTENLRVFKNFVKNMIPQTGFQGHNRGRMIEQKVEQRDYQGAIDMFNEHQVRIDPDQLFPLPWCDENGGEYVRCMEIAVCRLIVPSIDTLLTERLGTQATVITSLMQALYDNVKTHVRTELADAERQLKALSEEADMLGDELANLMVEHVWERLVIFVMCGGSLIICIVSIWTIRKAQLAQQDYYSGMMTNVTEISEQASRIGQRYTLRRGVPMGEPSFRFSEGLRAGGYRESERKDTLRLK